MTALKHDGVAVRIGEREWIVAPLNIRLLRRYLPRLSALGQRRAEDGESGPVTAEDIGTLIEVIHAALCRNYPDLSLAEVEEMLDLESLGAVFAAVCGASGLAPRERSGDAEPGEAVAGDRTRSIGTI